MNIVINPSGTAGFSFKGLHAYCAHDKDGPTSERVTWMAAHNIAANPKHAYKVMIATAEAQNELKRKAGVRAGRKAQNGEVMHIVMAFDKDEPKDQATREAAAKELLSFLGREPGKRGGKGAVVRQFADEHQAVFYAHEDTENDHVHIMLNMVHPVHGRRLPTSNDQIKASRWALDFSKKHGTDHKTPAREENMAARDRGEYVKAKRRQSRKSYEEERSLQQASNDNSRVKAFLENQKRKDAALYAGGRALLARQQARIDKIEERFEQRVEEATRALKQRINQAKAAIREEFRPQLRALKTRQAAERKTFAALEASFFGRTKNALSSVRDAFENQDKGLISRTFRILSSSGERKAYFERGQQRELAALEKEKADKIAAEIKFANNEHSTAYSDAQTERLENMSAADELAADETQAHQADWRARNQERKAEFAEFQTLEQLKPTLSGDFGQAQMTDDYFKDLERRSGLSEDFDDVQQSPAPEQDNDYDDGQERS